MISNSKVINNTISIRVLCFVVHQFLMIIMIMMLVFYRLFFHSPRVQYNLFVLFEPYSKST